MSYQLPFEINIYCFHVVLNSSVAHTVETSEALFSVASQPQKIPLGWVPKTYLAIEVIVIMISLGLLTECDHVAGYQKSYEIWSQNNHLFALWPWAGDLTFLTPLISASMSRVKCSSSCSPAIVWTFVRHIELCGSLVYLLNPSQALRATWGESLVISVSPCLAQRLARSRGQGFCVGGEKKGRKGREGGRKEGKVGGSTNFQLLWNS